MSGSPQGEVTGPHHRIRLFKTFRRAVPAGSDYFERNRERMVALVEANAAAATQAVRVVLGRAGIGLLAFDAAAFDSPASERGHPCCVDSSRLLTEHAPASEMHAIHVELSLVATAPLGEEVQRELALGLFELFNPAA